MDDTMNDTNVATLADAVIAEAQQTAETSAPVETADAPAKPKRVRKGKAKPAAKAKPAVSPIKRDEWHVKIGGSGHAINCYLRRQAGKPRTIAEIHDATTDKGGRATAGATRGHVIYLLARGFVKLKDGGYVIATKKAKGEKPAPVETADE